MPTSLPLERFLKTAAMLGSPNEQERATAAKQATSMLTAAGLDWNEVLRRGLAEVIPPSPGDRNREGGNDIFGSVFNDFFSRARAPRPAPQAAPKNPPHQPNARAGSKIIQGEDIPYTISGTVTVTEKRLYAEGKFLLVVGIFNKNRGEQYNPVVAFDPATISALEAAAKSGGEVTGRVRQPRDTLGQPVFSLTGA